MKHFHKIIFFKGWLPLPKTPETLLLMGAAGVLVHAESFFLAETFSRLASSEARHSKLVHGRWPTLILRQTRHYLHCFPHWKNSYSGERAEKLPARSFANLSLCTLDLIDPGPDFCRLPRFLAPSNVDDCDDLLNADSIIWSEYKLYAGT